MRHRIIVRPAVLIFAAATLAFLASVPLAGQSQTARAGGSWGDDPPPIASLVAFAKTESDLRVAVDRYLADKAAIERRYDVPYSPVRHARLRKFYDDWRRLLNDADFSALNREGQTDYVLLRNRVDYDVAQLDLADRRWKEMAPLLPFADSLRRLQEDRHDRERAEGRATATSLSQMAAGIAKLTQTLSADSKPAGATPVIATRAMVHVGSLRTMLADWYAFYDGYDPVFSWWTAEPFGRLDKALAAYSEAMGRQIAGLRPGQPAPIVGDPVLAEGLKADLAYEMLPYSAEELIAIGEREFAWIEGEFQKVSRDMGFADDWKAALEHTKNLAPPPGDKPWIIFDIAKYSEAFVSEMNAITMPPLAAEVWRLAMQTPERQLINPFFTGGELTRVSYPVDTMTHEEKLMSMRGNTPHFNFATVHHELIPGHHLQAFVAERYNPHRATLQRTPFWREGWALYWELQLWDRKFPRNNPDKIGMLFWRLHRAARIIFSLNYHLGRWSPQQCIDFLVDRVGHEAANAEGEVRRTTIDAPLYQVAYMMGGLQFRALYKELVDSGKMTPTAFHDNVLIGGYMPVELVRARLAGLSLSRDYQAQWKFDGR